MLCISVCQLIVVSGIRGGAAGRSGAAGAGVGQASISLHVSWSLLHRHGGCVAAL